MDTPPSHIRTQSDLLAIWSCLLTLAGPERPTIWLMLIQGDDTPIRQLTELEDVALAPGPDDVDTLATLLSELVTALPDVRVAFLLGRPGRGPVSADDRAWASGLLTAARRASMACEVVHLLTGGRVVPLPADELGTTLSA